RKKRARRRAEVDGEKRNWLADGPALVARPDDRLPGLEDRRTRLELGAHIRLRLMSCDTDADDCNTCDQRDHHDLDVGQAVRRVNGAVVHDKPPTNDPWFLFQGPTSSHRMLDKYGVPGQRDVTPITK